MIFVTVGTQLPFERLIKSIDDWSAKQAEQSVIAQVGSTEYTPQHMQMVKGLSPEQYKQTFASAEIIVSHVGMGTIIAGLLSGKPMILMPRLAKLGEHRNDHQLSTAKKFAKFALIDIVNSEEELHSALCEKLAAKAITRPEVLTVSPTLRHTITRFVDDVRAGL